MKLLFRTYLSSLRERGELDAILPDLLSELGYHVYSRPQLGTTQAGVDIAAVGNDDDGERKLFLFSIKQGDLTRQSWDGNPQALRPSLNEILDVYIPTRIPKRYHDLKIIICLVFGGDMQEQVRSAVSGYTKANSTDRISFDEWNGDRLAGLLLQGVLREEIMPKNLRSHFQKAIALLDDPDIACHHFGRLVYELSEAAKDGKTRIRTARQLYIALWVLFVWARDIDNVEAPYRASELVLLSIWNLLRPYIGKERSTISKAIIPVLHHALALHVGIASELLEKKILPHIGTRDGISMAVRTRSSVDVNLRLFDILGRIGLTAIWKHWLNQLNPDMAQRALAEQEIAQWTTFGYQLIENNRALFLPLRDEHAIEIALFLISICILKGNGSDARSWLDEMARRLAFTVQTHGRYPCIFADYRDLDAHPREKTDEYRKEATAGSILIPLIAAFLSTLDSPEGLKQLVALKEKELQHCTLQLWMPDRSSEDGIYLGALDHGVALCDLPLSTTGVELINTVREACDQSKDFEELSAIKTGYWPVILTACRHHRLPVPPQFWIKMVSRSSDA